jgi:uncharacterized membrane protein YagU involved in acid resistance
MKPEIKMAVIGGVAGTLVMTMMMMYMAPMLTGIPMDIAAMLGAMLGGYMVGMTAHIMMGIIVFPLIYVFVLYERLPGSPLIKGLAWGVVLWVLAATMVMPMAGGGFLMSNIGGMMALVASLMGHLVYGGLLGAIAGDGATSAAASA